MTLHIFAQRSKQEIDSHCENLSHLLYFPCNIYQSLCDQSKPKVFSSPTPLALIKKNEQNNIKYGKERERESSEDMEYLQMEKGRKYEGVNLRVLSSGWLASLSLWVSLFHVISFSVNPSLSRS